MKLPQAVTKTRDVSSGVAIALIPHGDYIPGGDVCNNLASKLLLLSLARQFGPIAYTYAALSHDARDAIPLTQQLTQLFNGLYELSCAEPIYRADVVAVA